MIEKLSPTLELALQNELRQAYLKGVETGRKIGYEAAKKEVGEFIVLPPAVAYEIHEMGDVKEIVNGTKEVH